MVKLTETTLIHAPIDRCFDLARSVEAHLAGNAHWGESALATAGVTSGLIDQWQQVTWRAKHFGIRFHLTSRITSMDRPSFFRDEMLHGPFRFMSHDHFFQFRSAAETEMKDEFYFAAPLPLVGRLAERVILTRYMRNLLRERNAVLKEIAESSAWRTYLPLSAAQQHLTC